MSNTRVLVLVGSLRADSVNRKIAEILRDEEGHVDFLETQFEMIKQMGLQNYIQLQSEAAEE